MAKIIKGVSVLLCAVVLACCCFTGCGSEKITQEQLVEIIKDNFPEAHIGYEPGRLNLNEDEKRSVIFLFSDENTCEYIMESRDFDYVDFRRLKTLENTKKILNTVMPVIDKDWNLTDTQKFIDCASPNADFTAWQKNFAYYKSKNRTTFSSNLGDEVTIYSYKSE